VTGALAAIAREIVACRRCPRLVSWREAAARNPPKRFRGQTYWARPLPGFGDPAARILIVGLAPAAHGGNRTGRVFTGDASGDFLFRALFEAGLANQPLSTGRGDGLVLSGAFVSAAARCAPPDNRPTPAEFDRCRPFLVREIAALPSLRVVVALGGLAFSESIRALACAGEPIPRPRPRFGHGAEIAIGRITLLGAYHPSQQNTFTGRLTAPMLLDVFRRAGRVAGIRRGSGRLYCPARMRDIRARVESRSEHAPGLFSLFCSAPDLARRIAPGQFAMIGVEGRSQPYLRRAFSVADADRGSGVVEFLVKVVGVGTACLAGLAPAEELQLLAPLGNAFATADLVRGDRVAIVAGGVGVAPFPLLLRALAERGIVADLYFGGRSAPDLAYRERIAPLVAGRELLSTDDGTLGERGRVTDLLARELAAGTRYRRLYACGPTPMFRTLARLLEGLDLPAEFSTEAPMGCGFGVCLACVLPRAGGGFLVSCREGPILAPAAVDWSRC